MSPPRHVLITGGSRGIGLAIAKSFSQHNYRCTLIARNESSLQDAITQLMPLDPSSPGTPDSQSAPPVDSTPQHAYIAGDITCSSQFWSTAASTPFGAVLPKPTSSRHGEERHASKIDVLVNCAGVTQSKLFIRSGHEDIHNIVAVNLSALMTGTRFLLRNEYLRGKLGASPKKGEAFDYNPVIINVASLLGVSGGYGAVAYAASKAGVLGFTRALATEYASHGVRVNAIVPGYVETDMTKDLNEDQLRQRIPLGRFGKPEEIAHAALFLAQNQYAHNCVMNLDGGLSAV
jgi:NAD(P)-dependent dehydrogenase (short-subunit alcohol dehydrogenase family)